jgi:transcriptional regulator with XRE-family HTH domain
MTIDFKPIGKRVRANRTNHRMTQAELAEKTGMSDVYISRIETGVRSPSLSALLKIAIVLEISLDSLVLDDSLARLPKGYREFWELLADCDINERTMILKTATAYKKVLRKEQKGENFI